jgi:hypothetical protein
MPQVVEAARANEWRKTGGLGELYGTVPLTNLVKVGVDIVESSQRQVANFNVMNPPDRK